MWRSIVTTQRDFKATDVLLSALSSGPRRGSVQPRAPESARPHRAIKDIFNRLRTRKIDIRPQARKFVPPASQGEEFVPPGRNHERTPLSPDQQKEFLNPCRVIGTGHKIELVDELRMIRGVNTYDEPLVSFERSHHGLARPLTDPGHHNPLNQSLDHSTAYPYESYFKCRACRDRL
jgi:hypothetical protein